MERDTNIKYHILDSHNFKDFFYLLKKEVKKIKIIFGGNTFHNHIKIDIEVSLHIKMIVRLVV